MKNNKSLIIYIIVLLISIGLSIYVNHTNSSKAKNNYAIEDKTSNNHGKEIDLVVDEKTTYKYTCVTEKCDVITNNESLFLIKDDTDSYVYNAITKKIIVDNIPESEEYFIVANNNNYLTVIYCTGSTCNYIDRDYQYNVYEMKDETSEEIEYDYDLEDSYNFIKNGYYFLEHKANNYVLYNEKKKKNITVDISSYNELESINDVNTSIKLNLINVNNSIYYYTYYESPAYGDELFFNIYDNNGKLLNKNGNLIFINKDNNLVFMDDKNVIIYDNYRKIKTLTFDRVYENLNYHYRDVNYFAVLDNNYLKIVDMNGKEIVKVLDMHDKLVFNWEGIWDSFQVSGDELVIEITDDKENSYMVYYYVVNLRTKKVELSKKENFGG